MIKLFGKGLGPSHPLEVSRQVSVSTTPDGFSVSNSSDTLHNGESDELFSNNLPGPAQKIPSGVKSVQNPNFKVTPNIQPQVFSQESAPAPYETLFTDFQLEAYPFYNFWTRDERTNDSELRGNRKLEDLPRFIKVVWTPAPDLPGPEKNKPRDKSARQIKTVKFAAEIEKPFAFTVKGISFSPNHLQPVNFSQARHSLVNGQIGPGVIESVVEIPFKNIETHSPKLHQIDEDAFLTSPVTKGIAIQELRAQVHQMTNGVLGSADLSNQKLSDDARQDKDLWFDGKFAVNRSTQNGGNIELQSVHPSSPALSLSGRTAQRADGDGFDHVLDIVSAVSQPETNVQKRDSAHTKVKFVQPTLGGILDQKKINTMSRPEHAENMMALAHVLPQLESLSQSGIGSLPRKGDITSFPSPMGLKPLEYVGYVLEKYKRNKSGAFEKVEEIEFPSREYSEYYDTKIVYGEVYRYRIRSILRWTRHSSVGPFGRDKMVITKNGSQTSALSQFKSSYFGSEWSERWAYASVIDTMPPPSPDELQVRPESAKRRIFVTFKLPDNQQRDIFQIRLFRKLQDVSGKDLTGWTTIQQFGPKNGIYVDSDVDFFQRNGIRYVYSAQCVTYHGEYSAFSEQIGARLNEDHRVHGEYPVDFVSCAGVKSSHFGAFSVYPVRKLRSEIILQPETPSSQVEFVLQGRNTNGNSSLNDKTYWVRVESLDTGEYRDHRVDVDYINLKHHTNRQFIGVFVPPKKTPPPPKPSKLVEKMTRVNKERSELETVNRSRPGEYWKKA